MALNVSSESQPDPSKLDDRPPEESVSFEQELEHLARSLHDLQARYTQVQQDQQTQATLQAQLTELQAQRSPTPEDKLACDRLATQLAELEVRLESRLFWGSIRPSFWQIIRIGGLGLLIGWGLAFTVIRHPQPSSSSPIEQPRPR